MDEVQQFNEFVKEFVTKKSAHGDLLYQIENGRIRPTKSLQDALATMVRGTPVFDLLDEQFTIAELQRLYESILGVNFDRRNFYRKMLQTGVLEEVEDDKPQWKYFGEMKEMRVMPVDDLFGGVKESAPCPAPSLGSSNAFILPLADEAEDGTAKATARIKRIHELLRSNSAKDEPCEITSAMMSNDDAAPERSRSVGRKGKLYRFNEEKYNRMKEDGNFRLEF